MIPSSGAPVPARMRPADAYFDLIAETLEGLDAGARAQFLHRFFLTLAHVEIPEPQAAQLWDEVLVRRGQLSQRSETPVAFHTALVDVLSGKGMYRTPVIVEFEDLKNLHKTAVTDALTGLHNRRLFDESFEKELTRARRYSQPLSLVILDLHRFKEVNDTYGHPRGDDVLHAAAATLRKALRTSDSAFRIGGDEFAVLLPQTDSAQALALSRRMGSVFSETLHHLHLEIGLAMDHGVSTYPQDGDSRDQLFHIADERLYAAKYANHRKSDQAGASGVTATPARTQAATPPATTTPVEPLAEPPSEAAPDPGPAATTEAAPPPPPVPDPIRIEAKAAESDPGTSAAGLSPLASSPVSFGVAQEETRLFAVPRKAERVSMVGTNAYAVLGGEPNQRARVVDLGFGGVALDFPLENDVPENLLAVLHVPILPPVRVNLKRVWSRSTSEGTLRVGCCFVS